MKQSISPAIAIVSIAVVAVIAVFFVMRAFAPVPNQASNMSPSEYQRKMQEQSGKAAEAMKQKPEGGGDAGAKMRAMYGGGGQKPAGGN